MTPRLAFARSGSGRAVLLLHGLGGASAFWGPLRPYLGEADVLTPDLLGHGRSPAPDTDYTLEQHLQALEALLDDLDFPRCTAIGHSFGGMLAAALAAQRPERVEELLILQSPLPVDEATNLRDVRRGQGVRWLTLGEGFSRFALWVHRHPWLRPWAYAGYPDDVVLEFQRTPWYVVHRTLWNAVIRQDLRERVRHVQAPTTVVIGGRDRVVLPYNSERYLRLIPGAVGRTLPEADHEVPWFHPDQLLGVGSSIQL